MSKPAQPSAVGDLHAEREDYQKHQLNRNDLAANPVEMFARWMQDARNFPLIDAKNGQKYYF